MVATMQQMIQKLRSPLRLACEPSFWLILVACGLALALVWWLEVLDGLPSRIVISVLAALMPVLAIWSVPSLPQWRWPLAQLVAFLVGAGVLVASGKFGFSALAANSAVVLALLPLWWIVWRMMRGRWFLVTGLALATVVIMIYWTAALVLEENVLWEVLLLPLTVVVLTGTVWSPLAVLLLRRAVRRRRRWLGGPGFQSLVMAWLFLPTIVVAVFVPSLLGLPEIWTAVSLTLTGFILSTVVSAPLRRFLLRWSKLELGPNPPKR